MLYWPVRNSLGSGQLSLSRLQGSRILSITHPACLAAVDTAVRMVATLSNQALYHDPIPLYRAVGNLLPERAFPIPHQPDQKAS